MLMKKLRHTVALYLPKSYNGSGTDLFPNLPPQQKVHSLTPHATTWAQRRRGHCTTAEMTKVQALKRWGQTSIRILSLHYTLQLSSREQQCSFQTVLPHFLTRNGQWFIRPLHTDTKSPALHRAAWRYQSFLWVLLGVRFATGVKQHSVTSNGDMPIYMACRFCSFISYISVLNIFQLPSKRCNSDWLFIILLYFLSSL